MPPRSSQRARRFTLARLTLTLALVARRALGLCTLERLIRERRRH